MNVIHGDHSAEIHRLREENEQLHMENNQFQRMQETVSPLPNYSILQNRGRKDSQYPWDQFKFLEPKLTSQSVHLEIAELKHKLKQTQTVLQQNQAVLQKTQTLLQQTQAELRLNQGNYNRCQKELEQMQIKVLAFDTFQKNQ